MILALTYFGLGVVLDAVIAKYYLALARGQSLLAGTLSFIITVANLWVVEDALVNRKAPLLGLCFALGAGVGTYLAVGWGDKKWKA